jgi:GntR family transcriptional regulator
MAPRWRLLNNVLHVMTSEAKTIPVLLNDVAFTLSGQLREAIRIQIHTGDLKTGDRLPSESDLGKTYGVSRITVRQAMSDLASEGLIVRHQGKGSFVSPGTVRQELNRLQGLTEALVHQGKRVQTEVLLWRKSQAPSAIRLLLGLSTQQQCMALHTLRFVDEKPISINRTWLSAIAAKGITRQSLQTADLLTLYDKLHGVRLARASVEISSALATEAQSQKLGLISPASVLLVAKTVYAHNDQVLHCEQSVYNPAMFRYSIELTR